MTGIRPTITRAALVATGALALTVPAAAQAATSAVVTGGTTTVRPSGAAYRVLTRAGVRVRAVGDARARRGAVALPVTGGTRGSVTVLEHGPTDGLLLQRADDAVRLTSLRIRLGKSSRVTGRIDGGKARTLFVLKASRLSGAATATRANRSKVTWRLAAGPARALRSALGVRGLRAGAFASSTLTATLAAPGTPGPGGPVTPGAPAPGVVAAPTANVVAGAASWGLKESFRRYVPAPIAGPPGKTEVSDGATIAPDGTFAFAPASGTVDRASGGVDVTFRGTVYFEKHGSGDSAALRVWVRNPRVLSDGRTATLHADMSSKDLGSGRIVDYPGVALATLDLTKGSRTATDTTVTWTGIPATLTEAGVPAFANNYAPGTALDPISFSVTTG